ncbi:type IX secretion system outer membrane channel protein PorV [Roseivirga sp. BDSF3-8]|uniref:type IX secretion system outer membrane channel protein PorV n=1 Tax=Roseivirga sp. BDSF3-8 TaxID=3241598 RepID=UPI0035323AB7
MLEIIYLEPDFEKFNLMTGNLKTFCVLLFLALVPVASAFSQVGIIGQDTTRRVITTAVPFIMIAPDARAGGMGDVGAATSADAASIHWNPAKLIFNQQDYGFSLSYTPWLGRIVNDMWIFYASGYYKLDDVQAIGLSMTYFDLGDLQFRDDTGVPLGDFSPREFALTATYSRQLTESLSLGVSGKYIHSNLTGNIVSSGGINDSRAGTSVAADIGVYYNSEIAGSATNNEISWAAVISNIGQKMTYSDEDNRQFIPTNLRLGGAYKMYLDPYNSITFALDANKLMVPTPPVRDENGNIIRGEDPDRSLLSGMFGSFGDAPDGGSEELKEVMLSAGAEYWYNDIFAFRAGYFYEHEDKGNRKYFTVGTGFRYQVFGIDFAYLIPQVQDHPLAETLRFTLVFNFENNIVSQPISE